MKTVTYYNAAELKELIRQALAKDNKSVKAINFTVMRDDGARLARSDISIECAVEIEDGLDGLQGVATRRGTTNGS